MKEIMEILNNLDWSPLFISIKTGYRGDHHLFLSRHLCGT